MEKIKVENARLYEEDGKFYIDVTYLYEDDEVVKRIRFPKIRIPVELFKGSNYRVFLSSSTYYVKLGGYNLFAERNKDGVCYIEEIVEERPIEMTLDELEKKLGHKIKIINNK